MTTSTGVRGKHILRWKDRDDDGNPVDGWLDCSTAGDYAVVEVRDDGTLRHISNVWTKREGWAEIHRELDEYNYGSSRVFVIVSTDTSEAVASHGDETRIPQDLRESTLRGLYG